MGRDRILYWKLLLPFILMKSGVGGQVAVVGIGSVPFGSFPDRSVAAMANEAVIAALADAGLQRGDLDGLVVHIGSPRGADYDTLAQLLGLNVRFASQTWSHGRFCATVIEHGAMAIMSGLARYVLCVAAFRNSSFPKYGMPGFPDEHESLREGGGPHAEAPSAGLSAPMGGAALALQTYLARHHVEREKLGAVAIAQRKWAQQNPNAVKRRPITQPEYEASPWVVEPLRRLDCSVPIDMAVGVILARSEDARSLRSRPVRLVSFQGMAAGPNEFVFGQPGLGIGQADVFDYVPLGREQPVFASAGLTPQDIDAFYCYDGFSPQVLWTLERFGFCDVGGAADWIQGGRTAPGGPTPVNTCGGHLSEGHSNGWGQTLEIVRQLRGEAADRQIADCRLAMWATTLGDAIVYGC